MLPCCLQEQLHSDLAIVQQLLPRRLPTHHLQIRSVCLRQASLECSSDTAMLRFMQSYWTSHSMLISWPVDMLDPQQNWLPSWRWRLLTGHQRVHRLCIQAGQRFLAQATGLHMQSNCLVCDRVYAQLEHPVSHQDSCADAWSGILFFGTVSSAASQICPCQGIDNTALTACQACKWLEQCC